MAVAAGAAAGWDALARRDARNATRDVASHAPGWRESGYRPPWRSCAGLAGALCLFFPALVAPGLEAFAVALGAESGEPPRSS